MTAREPGEDPRHCADPAETWSELERLARESAQQAARSRISLDEALRQRWLEVWYQPKFDLRRQNLAGAEALARINHPELGVLGPSEILAGADDDSLVRLTEHAMLATMRDWATFEQGGINLRLAINVPMAVLFSLPIPTLVREHRPKPDYWPGLIVEVPEDQIARDFALASELSGQLGTCGLAIAIDEFGGGYSSFANLRELAFAELKLSQAYVHDCATEATNGAICQTAIDLAHRFGSVAVAKGVEGDADLKALQVMRCDLGQGMLLAPPMPKERLIALIKSQTAWPTSEVRPAAGFGSRRSLLRR